MKGSARRDGSESRPFLKKLQKTGVEAAVLGLEELCPPLRKLWKPGAEAPEQEDGVELQRKPLEEQSRPM